MQQNPLQDPDRAPDETLFEQAAEIAAFTGEDSRLGPADIHWVPDRGNEAL